MDCQLSILILFLCLSTRYCLDIPWPPKEGYYDQTIDHFNFRPTNSGFVNSFKQRYIYEDKWYKPGGPIFFYCGNENAIDGFWNNTGFMFELAPKFNALIIFGEHRYYGKSLPFGPSKSFIQPFIQYLSVEQAITDFVYLLTDLKSLFNMKQSPVIAFGGSYGGCLAAYLRFRNPNIVLGALASSAPLKWVTSKPGFHKFFEHIAKVFHDENPACPNIVRQGFKLMKIYAGKGKPGFKAISRFLKLCKPITSVSEVTHAMKWIREAFLTMAMVNYPYAASFMGKMPAHPVRVACQKLISQSTSPIAGLRDAVAVVNGPSKCYSPKDLYVECADITGCGPRPGPSPWDFQVCTEMPMYDESNATKADMFPSLPLTLKDFTRYCQRVWQVKTAHNQLKLLQWGDDVRAATNVIFSNGDLDPWSLGGILSNATLQASSVALIVKGGAHHLDLRSSNPADPPGVVKVRKIEEEYIRKWLGRSRN